MRELLEACRGRLPERRLAAGDIVMAEGERDDQILVLAEGEVEVLKDGVSINTIGDPGAVFGEMAVLLDTAHTATVRAVTPCRFYVVDEPRQFLRSTPDVALNVARLLAKRLHAMTTYLVDLKLQFRDQESHLAIVDEVLDALSHAQHEEHDVGSDRDPDPDVD